MLNRFGSVVERGRTRLLPLILRSRVVTSIDEASGSVLGRHVVMRRVVSEAATVTDVCPDAKPSEMTFSTERRHLTFLRDVAVSSRLGIARTRDGRLFVETLVRPANFDTKLAEGKLSRRLPRVHFDDPTAVIPVFRNHYILWRETLARLPSLLEPEIADLGSVTVALNDDLPGEGEALLRRLLPKNCVLRRVPRNCLIVAPMAIDLPQVATLAVPEPVIHGLREMFDPIIDVSDEVPRRPVYVSRSGTTKRPPINEEALLPALASRGVRTVHLERLSLPEQLRTFSSASGVIAQHGAGLVGLLFAPPGSRILEVHSDAASTARLHYRAISASVGLEYSAHYGESDDPHAPARLDVGRIGAWIDLR